MSVSAIFVLKHTDVHKELWRFIRFIVEIID